MGPIWEEDHTSSTVDSQNAAIAALKVFAWFDLVSGFLFALTIWLKFSTPVAIGISIAVFLQGIFVCALFLVIASIAENLIAIRENTTQKAAE